MYTTGRFAFRYRVSKKLLRHYNEIGLLVPEAVDALNGYAQYGESQCTRMERILYLRALRLPLEEIRDLLERPECDWADALRPHLLRIRAERRALARVEAELCCLLERIPRGKGLFDRMNKRTERTIDVFTLEEPIWVVGLAARVAQGTPEHMPTIEALIGDYYGNDVPARIPNRVTPRACFGICAELAPEDGTFTYMMGDRVRASGDGAPTLPDGTRSYAIPAGTYARIAFRAANIEEVTGPALGDAYGALFAWIGASDAWESAAHGVAYEVYEDERFEVPSWPEMEVWAPVRARA